MPNMKSLSLMVQKVIAKVKVDNRQTGQKQYAPVHSIRGHKKLKLSKNYKLILLLQKKKDIFYSAALVKYQYRMYYHTRVHTCTYKSLEHFCNSGQVTIQVGSQDNKLLVEIFTHFINHL